MSRHKLLLLDANALLHRAWHAIPPLAAPNGMLVNAAYGMASVALKIIKEQGGSPLRFIACWDTAAPTFRHERFEAYKAQRKEKEQELYDQIPLAKEVLEAIGVKSVAMDGYEADDLVGTLAVRGANEGHDVFIITGDRDTLQLVNDQIRVIAFKKGVSETKIYDAAAVEAEYGVTPRQVIDWKAIKGDPSDNIPGIKGIGDKGATELIQAYGSLEDALRAARDAKSDMKEGLRKKLLEGEAEGREALELVTVDTSVPIKETINELIGAPDRERLVSLAGEYGFRSLIARFDEAAKGEAGRRGATRAPASDGSRAPDAPRASMKKSNNRKSNPLADLARISGDHIVVHVLREAQDSLFGSADPLLIVANEEACAVIPFSAIKSPNELRAALLSSLDGRSVICHDAKSLFSDLESLESADGLSRTLIFSSQSKIPISHDTLLAAYLLSAGERAYDLQTLSLLELGAELPESRERARDIAEAIRTIAERQRAKMDPLGMTAFMTRFELPLTPVLRDMERVGIKIDLSYLKTLSGELGGEKARLEREMEEMAGRAFNPASPSQLAVILFEELKLPTKGIKRGKTGYSTAAAELEKLEGLHPLIEKIGEHREIAKLLSTYVDALPAQADAEGRVHTTFNQAITSTGRLSSSDPNLQNIPIRSELGRKIRRAFIAGKVTSCACPEQSLGGSRVTSEAVKSLSREVVGLSKKPNNRIAEQPNDEMELLSCDYSQIELRVIAALAKDKKMLAAFESGADIHAATAAAIWGIELSKVTKEQRRAAKAVNFGIIYGQGPQGLAKSAGIPFEEARAFIEKYFETYRGIHDFLETTKALARERGYVETLFGRRRPIPDIVSGVQPVRAAAERMAINMPVQGTSADILKLAMIEIAKGLPGVCEDARLLLQVHDELLFEVPADELPRVAAYVKDVMEHIEKIGCPLIVDARRGKNWGKMEGV